jgi:hypothetical protein
MRHSIWIMFLALAACGGSGNGNGGGNNIPPVITAPTCGTTVPTSGSFTLSFRFVDEVEPNGDISTAYPANLATLATPEDRVGVILRGSINDTSDLVDTFSFTSSRTMPFFFKLCRASCNTGSGNDRDGNPDSLDVTIANFSVIDADGNVMMTTNGNNPAANYGGVCVEGGVITYIAVHADNTMGLAQEYRLSAIETLN